MASKSKRRGRVFRASCILAALIIAGSSFAWFTSSDEVTNRLSANADYDVSIVESYAPPKNWLPGQEVNKDVYATNTGTIGAFVREDVSGTLTVTKDIATTDKTDKSIELTPEERYAVEAGAFLAYKPADSKAKLGDQIVIRPADKAGTPTLTDFSPDESGLYVFRRSVAVDGSAGETFKYDGYYVDVDKTDSTKNKYYKISNLNVVQDAVADKAGDGKKTDGNLAAASAGFWEEHTEVAKPVALEYKENPDGHTGKYLVASYDTGNYKAEANYAAAADAYDQAIHNYEYLTALAAAATREATAAGGGTGGALETATNALNTAWNTLNDAINNTTTGLKAKAKALEDAQINYNNALADKAYAKQKVDDAKTKLYGAADGGTTAPSTTPGGGNYTPDSIYGKYHALTDPGTAPTAAQNVSTFLEEVQNWFDANKANNNSQAKKIADDNHITNKADLTLDMMTVAAYEEFCQWVAGNEEHDYYIDKAKYEIAKKEYEDAMVELYGAGHATDGSDTNYLAGNGSLYGKYKSAETNADTTTKNALGNKTDTSAGTAWGDYNVAKAAVEAAQSDYAAKYKTWYEKYLESQAAEAKKDELVAAATAANDAMTAAENAMATALSHLGDSDGTLKIYIKLSDNVVTTGGTAEKWQLLPTTVKNDTAIFYYTSILEGGETSTKLIDSVELDEKATQDMYKYFDFDLNVALKSAQIVYDGDNETILATATPDELNAVATLAQPKDIDTAITWASANS